MNFKRENKITPSKDNIHKGEIIVTICILNSKV